MADTTIMHVKKAVHKELSVLKAQWNEKSLSDTVARLLREHDQRGG